MLCGQSVIKSRTAIPEPAKSAYQRGTDALKKGDVEAAISNYTIAISNENANTAGAYAGRGAAKRLKGDFCGALADLNKSIELSPSTQSSYYTRAWVNLILGNGNEAYGDAVKLLSFNDSNHLVFPSHVLIAYFGLRQAKRDTDADAFLKAAFPKLFSGASTTQVVRYLKHDLSDEQLFAASNGTRAMIEAKTYVGLDQSLSGKRELAQANLRWVASNSERRALEYSLASAEIERIAITSAAKSVQR